VGATLLFILVAGLDILKLLPFGYCVGHAYFHWSESEGWAGFTYSYTI